MVKISKSHHRTRKGVVKRNPPKKPKKLFDYIEWDFKNEVLKVKFRGRTLETLKILEVYDYFMEIESDKHEEYQNFGYEVKDSKFTQWGMILMGSYVPEGRVSTQCWETGEWSNIEWVEEEIELDWSEMAEKMLTGKYYDYEWKKVEELDREQLEMFNEQLEMNKDKKEEYYGR